MGYTLKIASIMTNAAPVLVLGVVRAQTNGMKQTTMFFTLPKTEPVSADSQELLCNSTVMGNLTYAGKRRHTLTLFAVIVFEPLDARVDSGSQAMKQGFAQAANSTQPGDT
jgi:hypothetical protein